MTSAERRSHSERRRFAKYFFPSSQRSGFESAKSAQSVDLKKKQSTDFADGRRFVIAVDWRSIYRFTKHLKMDTRAD
jgi:hypothetical protein